MTLFNTYAFIKKVEHM